MLFTVKTNEGEQAFKIPVLPEDIRLEQVHNYYNKLVKQKPEQLLKIEQEKDKEKKEALIKAITVKMYKSTFGYWFCKYVANFTDIPLNYILQTPFSRVEQVYYHINRILSNVPRYEYIEGEPLMINGVRYEFPARFMQDASTIQFIEALQIQHEAQEAKENFFLALNGVAAAILRQGKHEIFDDIMFEYRKKQFLKMNLKQAFKVAFFLKSRSDKLKKALFQYSAIMTNIQHYETPPELRR